jgi:adenylate cyclase
MAWLLATGVPLLGIVLVVIAELKGDSDDGRVLGSILFLATVGGAAGLATIRLAARSVADPVAGVERALERVERGDFAARSPVDDGSEVGLLQAGFNRMATGLAERERLRDAFGAFVDPSLAERILEQGTDLAGEEVDLTVLFVDVRGYTTLAERTGPREVVGRLNELYELVVPVITRHGGHANKFIGDGMLALFGAPERLADHADRAVQAALEIVELVRERFGDELRVGVGVNSGRVLVGTIGGGGRLDFTAIGDPVNTAARVEAATRQTGDDLLITQATREQLSRDVGDWLERSGVALKGKSEDVVLYAPA